MDREDFKSAFNDKYSITARKVLRMISSNSRVKITEMATYLDMSRRTVALKLAAIEKELKLHYILDFDEEKLGLTRPHLILVKFKGKPDYEKIKEILSRSYIPQLAVTISGTYDLLIYANAFSGREYAHWDKSMQILLSPYSAEWHTSEVVHSQLGFFPIRNEAIDRVNIKEKYKKILKILNENSKISFQGLAKALNMNVNTAVYNFNHLLELGYIKSFTAVMDSAPKNISLMTFFSKYTPAEGYESAASNARMAFTSDDENSLISRYLITSPLIGSYDFFTLGAFDNKETAYKQDILYHKNAFKKFNVRMAYGEVKDIILGKLPIRSIDTKKEYKTLIWNPEGQ